MRPTNHRLQPNASRPGSRALSVIWMAALVLVIIGFQNCGNLSPSSSAASEQALLDAEEAQDSANMSRLLANGSIKGWYSARESTIDLSGSSVGAWHSLAPGTLTLSAGSSAPTLDSSGTAPAIVVSGTSSLSSEASSAALASTTYSVVAVVDSGTSAAPALSGKLFSFTLTAGSQELLVSSTGASTTAQHLTSSGNSDSLHLVTPVGVGPIVIGVSFGSAWADTHLQINGQLPSDAGTYIGAPGSTTNLQRQFFIGDPTSIASLRVHEVMIFSSQLTPGELNSVSRFIGAKWGLSNVSLVR